MIFLKKVFPFLNWFSDYDKKTFLTDLFSGATVTVVLIPQAMAYAIIAGLPPVYGLYASLISVAVAAMWGSSRQLSTGPVAIVSFLVFSAVSVYYKPSSEEFITLTIFLALLSGIIQFLLGFLRLGFMMSFISHAVIIAFSTAAAIIIAVMQVPNLIGIEIQTHEYVWQNFLEILKYIGDLNPVTLSLGISSFVIIFVLKKISKRIPAALIVVILGIILTKFLELDTYGVDIVGKISSEFPKITFKFVPEMFFELLPVALVISIIGFLETFAVSKSIGKTTKQKIDVNQELIGQGLANVGSSIFQGYPVSGSFSRSAVNFSSGALTGMSSVFVSIFVLIVLLFFTQYLYFLPKTVLAAIVISAVLSLISIENIKKVFDISKLDSLVLVLVFCFSFVLKPDDAIFIGIILSLFIFFRTSMKTNVIELVYNKHTERLSSLARSKKQDSIISDNLLMIRIDMPIVYINSDMIMEKIILIVNKKKEERDIKRVLISFLGVTYIDSSGINAITMAIEELSHRGIETYFIHTRLSIKNKLEKENTLKKIKKFEVDKEAFYECK